EAITSTSMAAGLMQKLEFEKTTKKLYDGDYLVMVTDGVLDAFGDEPGEEILKEMILQAQEQMPKELGRHLLEKTLQYADYRAKDD
ncbi:SpoIIE family protein phosphatase, partial [Escherichia coli]|nr:SpoIIE family protein phosphatase [Escherichia coli]